MTLPLDLYRQPGCPPVVAADPGDDAPGWAGAHHEAVRSLVAEHGSVVVRGLGLRDADTVAAVFRRLGTPLMAEKEAFAPRETYSEGVYSATKWPPHQQMCMHHELSYTSPVPGLMMFACLGAPASGGATPVADAGKVLDALPGPLVDRFQREGWLLTRNYNEDIGASYADAFGTSDRAEVERYCRANDIEVSWQPDGGLRTRQRRQAVVTHPVTGRRCWFNQVAFLSGWTLDPDVREYLVDLYGADGLPFDTAYGNGDPIGEDVVMLLNEVYEAHTLRQDWQRGDLMLVDNIACAHGREPFEGDREVLVAMAEPVDQAPWSSDGNGGTS
ncbi:MAG: TauD/TfdA family dioxygenase [Nocardioidaceae bacterium]